MSATTHALEALCKNHPKFLKKGGLCVALVITETARIRGLPLKSEALRTGEGGQVAGLGRAAVQGILVEHGVTKVLAEEGGRTSRGSLGLMSAYVDCLNNLHDQAILDLDEALSWWVGKVRLYFASEGPKFHYDSGKSLRANIQDLVKQVQDLQIGGSTNYVGAVLQHLVGAKLDVVLGEGRIVHHGSSVADHSTDRSADFCVEEVAIHVTTHPSEALIRKCTANLKAGLKPLIITLADGVSGALFLLKSSPIADRVDILDIGQFLTANIYERSHFKTADCKSTFSNLLERYNEIVATCETDPSLRIRIPK